MNIEIELQSEQLTLLAEKAIWWERRATLLLTDTHFGKAATFRKAGIPVPAGGTQQMLTTLDRLIEKFDCDTILFLGDFVHSATRSQFDFELELLAWRAKHERLSLQLVRGNHDRGHNELFSMLRMEVVEEPFTLGPFDLCHFHETGCEHYTLAGHVHPGIRLRGDRQKKTPCFQFSERYALLPAFGSFTGLKAIRPNEGDRIFAVADGEVVEVPECAFATG